MRNSAMRDPADNPVEAEDRRPIRKYFSDNIDRFTTRTDNLAARFDQLSFARRIKKITRQMHGHAVPTE